MRTLSDSPHGLTASELALRLAASRGAVYRLLATLEEHRIVHRGPDNRFRLGLGMLRIAGSMHPLLCDAAQPALRQLAEETGATAQLSLANGTETTVLAVEEPAWSEYHVSYRLGLRRPLEDGAAGPAILAARHSEPAGCGESAGDGTTADGSTPGYLVRDEWPGVRGIAAAVRGVPRVEAAIGVVTLHPHPASHIGPQVVRAAETLADALR